MSLCKYRRGGNLKYILDKHFVSRIPFHYPQIISHPNCRYKDYNIIIYKGYEWDGPSGPAIDTDDFMDGSLVHDMLYQLMREKYINIKYRKEADKCLRKMCIEDGMALIRAWYVYYAVRLFAGKFAKG